jgi:hypothetical protein
MPNSGAKRLTVCVIQTRHVRSGTPCPLSKARAHIRNLRQVLIQHVAPPEEHCHNSKNTTFQERGKTTGRGDAIVIKRTTTLLPSHGHFRKKCVMLFHWVDMASGIPHVGINQNEWFVVVTLFFWQCQHSYDSYWQWASRIEKSLSERHGMEWHGMCESYTATLCKSNGKDTV